ncbi:hypothetical protein WICANDRAFT_94419 [Wickerhamomyces anomalus NRRL Y-366-8]|uniref:Uncharacterized protein n=1 Tax=Wickerhamomyces anomalus (strain ATCC 58044 / CBS 1984 / NCYC 433 / NRRL Y-366-8) TaxID=683960 RepID=A0A1E3P313_WICAA|nr:uncharacterized protein WICANDRAFT_94419 [Wickerhamomyces anomalus NRRL Y-366-8]ODQ59282.1 hypothetical protein WICANDRAFT_94419 [Wickerhamomyces anomalus NRRL Y-366-8]
MFDISFNLILISWLVKKGEMLKWKEFVQLEIFFYRDMDFREDVTLLRRVNVWTFAVYYGEFIYKKGGGLDICNV